VFAARDQPLANADRHVERPTASDAVARPTATEPQAASRWLETWLEQMRPRLVRLAMRFLFSAHDAEEVAQEALVLAWQRVGRLRRPDRRNAWLYRTTINLSMNRRRRKRMSVLPRPHNEPTEPRVSARAASRTREGVATAHRSLVDKNTDTSRRQQTAELMDRVRVAISELPERQHAALVLREMEGLAYDQIAVILQARPAAVRLLVHRAREALRQTLLRQWPDAFGSDR